MDRLLLSINTYVQSSQSTIKYVSFIIYSLIDIQIDELLIWF